MYLIKIEEEITNTKRGRVLSSSDCGLWNDCN
jgi:hypothetical protein